MIKEKQNGSFASCGRLSKECYKSILLEIPEDETVEIGTVKWICQSPFRKNHKLKNWFIEISEIGVRHNRVRTDIELSDKNLIRFETFRNGSKGG